MLQAIKGNPEVKIWNGIAEDWMNIEIGENELVKMSKDFSRYQVEGEWKQRNKTETIPVEVQKELDREIEENCKTYEWEFPLPYLTAEQEQKWYGKNRKRIILINGKKRNKSVWDRLGKMKY